MKSFHEVVKAYQILSKPKTRESYIKTIDTFQTNVGDAASFSLNALEAYSVTGIE